MEQVQRVLSFTSVILAFLSVPLMMLAADARTPVFRPKVHATGIFYMMLIPASISILCGIGYLLFPVKRGFDRNVVLGCLVVGACVIAYAIWWKITF